MQMDGISNRPRLLTCARVLLQVPALWLRRSFPSLKPLGGYVKELIERVAFFSSWLKQGAPDVFWISGFFFTQVGVKAVLDEY